MFVANSDYEYPFLNAMGAPGSRHFRAMEILGRLTWFVVTCAVRVDQDDFEILHSVCCSLDEDLLALLQPMPNARVVSVLKVVSSHDGDGRWKAREVAKVWRAVTDQGRQVLVFEGAEGAATTGLFDDPATDLLNERTLIFEAQSITLPNGTTTAG